VDTWLELPDGTRRRWRQGDIPTREMAVAVERKVRTEAFEGLWFSGRRKRSPTVAEVWRRYEPVSRRRNDSWQTDVGRARHFVRHLGRRKVDRLTRGDVERYMDARLGEASERTKRPPAVATVNREVSLLRHVINYAVECGDVASNPLAGVKLLKESNVRQRVIGEVEYGALRSGAEAPLVPMLDLAFDQGMRLTEIVRLRRSRVDLREGTIRLAPEDTKTDEARVILLTARSRASLARLPVSISGYVFVNPKTDKPWNDIRKMFGRACEAAGIEGLWFHDLRRSFVTAARRRGIPESVVMRMSGHRTREVFARYNVIGDEDLRNAREVFEAGAQRELEAAAGGVLRGV